ncbi:hypothetical protein IMY05_004G0036500 [Salix suchowensis]|nr:hypothetical protein IMY05_004G0036500 [Salix suchowensis]
MLGIGFLEAVHSSCIVNETPPTKQFRFLLFIIVLDPSKQVLAHHASELKKNKGLMKDCLSTMHGLFEVSAGVSAALEPPDDSAAKLIGQQ